MKVLVLIILVVILISSITIYTTQNRTLEAIDPTTVQNYPECAPDAFVKAQEKMPVKIRTPSYLPNENYKLIAVDIVSGEGGWVTLYYWDKDECPTQDLNDLVTNEGLVRIELYLPTPDNKFDSGEKFMNYMLEAYRNDKDTIADVQAITLSNGYKGIGWEPFIGVNKTINVKYVNGTEVEEVEESKPLQMPGSIKFIYEEDKIEYTVSANLPLDELIKIAESIS